MALSIGSQILVSDISNALAGKQDALGYVPVKSVNGTQADESGAVTITIGGGETAIAVSNVAVGDRRGRNYQNCSESGNNIKLPSGGTWLYFTNNFKTNSGGNIGRVAGGGIVTVYQYDSGVDAEYYGRMIAIRIA